MSDTGKKRAKSSENYRICPGHVTGLLGTDVSESLSPRLHNLVYKRKNISAFYKAFALHQEVFFSALKGLEVLTFTGINLTYPFKEMVISELDELGEMAEEVGAVNTVHFENGLKKGFNTDVVALERLFSQWFSGENSSIGVLLLGAGGAARAVTASLCYGISPVNLQIFVANRTPKRAERLADDLLVESCANWQIVSWKKEDISALISEVDLIVDATPLGWKGELFPGAEEIESHQRIFDLSYPYPPSALMKLARKKGCRRENGLRMLVYQAEVAHKIWFEEVDFPLDLLPRERYITME